MHDWTAPAVPTTEGTDEPPLNLIYSVEAPRVSQFAGDIAAYASPGVLAKWKSLILDPRYSIVLAPSLRYMRFPEDGFSDSAQFARWWHEPQFPLWNRLREVTEPD